MALTTLSMATQTLDGALSAQHATPVTAPSKDRKPLAAFPVDLPLVAAGLRARGGSRMTSMNMPRATTTLGDLHRATPRLGPCAKRHGAASGRARGCSGAAGSGRAHLQRPAAAAAELDSVPSQTPASCRSATRYRRCEAALHHRREVESAFKKSAIVIRLSAGTPPANFAAGLVVGRGQTEPSSARRELEIKNLGLESEV
jgi:hypothetical protein